MLSDIATQLEVAHPVLAILTEQMDAGIAITDMDGYARLMNRTARQMLRLSGDPVRKRLPELLEDPFRSFFQMATRRMPEHTAWSQEVEMPNRQILHVSVSPIYPASGSQQGAISIMQDVTPFRRRADLKSQLLAEIAQQLRTPVTTVRSALESLQLSPMEEQDSRTLHLAVNNVKRLSRLVNQVLETADAEQLHPQQCALSQCLANVMDLLSPDLEQLQASIEVEVDDGHQYVFGEPGKLEQLLLQILEAGVKKHKNVHLSVSQLIPEASTTSGYAPRFGFPGIAEQSILDIEVTPVYLFNAELVNRLVALHQGYLFWSDTALHVQLPADLASYEVQRLRSALVRAMQTATVDMPVSIILFRLSEPMGSSIKQKLCKRLQHVIRQDDVISHWLHPDHLLCLLHATCDADAESAVERLQRTVQLHSEQGDLPEVQLDQAAQLCFPGDFDSIEELNQRLKETLL